MSRIELTKRSQRQTITPIMDANSAGAAQNKEEVCQKEQDTLKNQKLNEEKSVKEIKWRQLPQGLYIAFYVGGGELPPELCGTWTSINKVQKAIESYMRKRLEERGF